MQKRLFLKNTIILTATAFILRGVGIFFRIYLSNAIGSVGMGIYQLIFSIYSLMSMLVSAGFSISATKLVANPRSSHRDVISLCFKFCILISLTVTFLFMLFSNIIAKKSIGYPEAASCIRLLSCGLIFISLSACLKGYFTGTRKVSVNSNSQLLEQAVRMGLCFTLLLKIPHSDIFGCCRAVVIANVVSEVFAFLFLYISYKKSTSRLESTANNKTLKRNFFYIFCPITLSIYLGSFLHTFENLIVPDAVFKYTLDKNLSISLFGMIKGMTIPVIFFPASFLGAVSTLLLPEITSMNKKSVQKTISATVHITLVSSLLVLAIFFVCAYEIADILYKEKMVGYFLRSLSLAIPFMYTESIIAGTLSALDLHIASLKFNILNSLLRISFILMLVPIYGIKAFLYIMILSNVFTSTINFIWLYRKTKFTINPLNFFLKPLLSAAIAISAGFLLNISSSAILLTVYRIALISAVYIICIMLFKTFDTDKFKLIILKKR